MTSKLTLTCKTSTCSEDVFNGAQGFLSVVLHPMVGWFVCCSVGRTRRGDEAAGASGQRAFSSRAGEQTSERFSAGGPTAAARAPETAGRLQPGQGQDGGAFTAQSSESVMTHCIILT